VEEFAVIAAVDVEVEEEVVDNVDVDHLENIEVEIFYDLQGNVEVDK